MLEIDASSPPGALWSVVRSALGEAVAVLLPVSCAGCDALDATACEACRAACAAPVRREAIDGIPVWFALDYAGPVARLVRAFKNAGRTSLAGVLAEPFGRSIDAALSSIADHHVEVVAVPNRRSSLRRRGYRPVRILARRAGVVLAPSLRFVRQPRDQVRLGRVERRENLAFAMRADTRMRGRRVLIVDDVLTTGATVRESARAVSAAGGRVVEVAVLARTRRGRRTGGVPERRVTVP